MSQASERVSETTRDAAKAPDAFRTISEVADELDLPQHVLRFWETRFSQIKPLKRGGGRRYYRPQDVDLLRGIRHLLYGEGYTIRGVQRILREQGLRFVIAASHGEVETSIVTEGDDDHPAANDDDGAKRMARRLAGDNAAERAKPPRASDADGAGLSTGELKLLEKTLSELLECKRLLDAAR